MQAKHFVATLLFALPAAGCASQGQQPVASNEPMVQVTRNEAARRVDVTVNGQPFTSYIYPTNLAKPTLYPIHTPGGKVITRGFPPRPGERVDHPHHVGLWFNYGNVNGLDFWNNSEAIKPEDRPKMGSVVHRAIKDTESGRGEGELDVTMDWVDHTGKVLLREDTKFVFHAEGNTRAIDRITTLTAVNGPVTMHDNKEGVLGLRVVRALEHPSTRPEVFADAAGRPMAVPVLNNEGVTGKYRTSEGIEGDAVWGTRGRWTTLSGTIEGEPVTVAILDHPKNVGFPTYWHARGYGLFAANPLGQADLSNNKERLNFQLGAGESTTFRHRILIASGQTTPEQMEGHYREFTS